MEEGAMSKFDPTQESDLETQLRALGDEIQRLGVTPEQKR